MEAVPSPLQRRDAVPKLLCPRSSQKRHAEVPALAPRKALKVSASSTAQWVVEAQAAIQHGAALLRANLKESVAQGEATEAAMEQAEGEEPTPHEAEAPWSAEVEDLCLRHADAKAEAAVVWEQATPLAARIKELEEELTWLAGERDTFRSQAKEAKASAKAIAGQLVTKQGLEKEVSWAAEASIAVQVVLEAKIGEHNALQSAARAACEALERALAVISSHYTGVDLEAISDGYVLAEDDEEADEEITKLMEVAKGPGTALAKLFEEEVVPPTPSTDAGDPEP
ncbi:basal body protein 10-like [Miscanthus floridulus]|uniref:basal body protein 10-like n=1 Tax=Miscanthus floridulus TaxID=154761 RepID=UPI00345AD996